MDLLDGEVASGPTNYENGLIKAFDVFDNSRSATESYSGCKTAILFLSDGMPTEGIDDAASLAQLVEDRNTIYDGRLFTFALGPTADEVSRYVLHIGVANAESWCPRYAQQLTWLMSG